MNSKPLTIGIAGEGKMGTNLFYYLLDFPSPLVWKCSKEADIEKIRKQFIKKVCRCFDARIMDERKRDEVLANTKITREDDDLAPCGLVIEAIPEDHELKKRFFAQLDRIAGPGCLFATNSSSIIPSALVPSENRKGDFIGLHFFYPVALKNVVELIFTEHTSEGSLHKARSFLDSIHRFYLPLHERQGFILNRIFLDFQNEAYLMVTEGKCTFSELDRIVKEHFFPSGVFEFFDSVGIDIMLASVTNYTRDYPHRDYYLPLIRKLTDLRDSGCLGQKTGKGFFDRTGQEAPSPGIPLDPAVENEIAARLRQAFIAAVKRFAARSGLPLDNLRIAVNEYFGVDWNLFP